MFKELKTKLRFQQRTINSEITDLKMNHIEILKLRNIITQINKSVDSFNSRLDIAKE